MRNEDLDLKSAMMVIANFGGRRKNRVKKSMFKAKWLPVFVMLLRWYGTFDFYSNPREIFMDYRENEPCIFFFYFITYLLLPYYMFDKVRNHELCFTYYIPLIYVIGINIEHLFYWSIIIKMEMIYFDFSLIGITLLLYAYVGISRIQNSSRIVESAC